MDAYNIINAWPELKEAAEEDLDVSRQRLIEILSNYQGYTKQKVIVVFDAHMVQRGKRKIQRHQNIEVIYTKESETADHYIEKLTAQYAKSETVRVATSDALQQYIILGQGATRVSARELLLEVEMVQQQIRRKLEEKNHKSNKNAFAAALSKEQQELFEKMRRQS